MGVSGDVEEVGTGLPTTEVVWSKRAAVFENDFQHQFPTDLSSERLTMNPRGGSPSSTAGVHSCNIHFQFSCVDNKRSVVYAPDALSMVRVTSM